MSIKEMTMHRLLAELKTYDDRIRKLTMESKFIDTNKNKTPEEVEELKNTLKGNLQKVRALISNKKNLETAKLKSNSETMVTIGSKSYTVADAIKRKVDVEYEKVLLGNMINQYNNVNATVENFNNKIKENGEKIALDLYKDDSDKKELFDEFVKNYIANNSMKVIDPNDIYKVITTMEEDVRKFITEVDAVLSESNAVTIVKVELED